MTQSGAEAQVDAEIIMGTLLQKMTETLRQEMRETLRQEMKDMKDDLSSRMDKLESSQKEVSEGVEKIRQKLKDMDGELEEIDRRLKAKESFPPPPYGVSPQQSNVVSRGSVSKPKWGKGSIFG